MPKTDRSAGITIPSGRLQVGTDDEALRRRREEIKRRLLQGEEVRVNKGGTLQAPGSAGQDSIQVPPGKLASFYWFERDPELFRGEQEAMRRFFPDFSLERESDGRLSWVGWVSPGMLRTGLRNYLLHAVYEHDHPNNDTYGGSIKVYMIDPDLNDLAGGTPIPHTLRDSSGQLYICTSRPEDFRAGNVISTTAASAVAWAVKWISAFELWLEGDLSTAQFADHRV